MTMHKNTITAFGNRKARRSVATAFAMPRDGTAADPSAACSLGGAKGAGYGLSGRHFIYKPG